MCGKKIRNLKGRRKDQRHFFCSRECYFEYLRTKDHCRFMARNKSPQLRMLEDLARRNGVK